MSLYLGKRFIRGTLAIIGLTLGNLSLAATTTTTFTVTATVVSTCSVIPPT